MRLTLFAVFFAMTCAPTFAADKPKPEPKYKGKPLAYWVERLQKEPTDEQQRIAANVIAEFGPDAAPAVPELIAMLDDRSGEYRELIANLLSQIGPAAKGAVPDLVKLLKEKNARDPEHVIRVLGAIGPDAKEAIPTLTALLDDRELRSFAVIALCNIGPAAKDSIPRIQRIVLEIVADEEAGKGSFRLSFRKEQQFAHCWPGEALGELHALGTEAVPVLLALLDAPGKRGCEYAMKEFVKLGPAGVKGVPSLKKLLKHNDAEVRYLACVTLWKVAKSTDVVPVLVELLNTKPNWGAIDPFARICNAAEALAEIGPAAKEALPALRVLAKNPPEYSHQDGVVFIGGYPSTKYLVDCLKESIDKIEAKPKK
jgi:HEAT repeat protein